MTQKPVKSETGVGERLQEILHETNTRHLIIRNSEDRVLFDISLTFGIIIGVILILIPGGIFIALFGAIIALATKLRIELVREVGDSDDVIEGQLSDND